MQVSRTLFVLLLLLLTSSSFFKMTASGVLKVSLPQRVRLQRNGVDDRHPPGRQRRGADPTATPDPVPSAAGGGLVPRDGGGGVQHPAGCARVPPEACQNGRQFYCSIILQFMVLFYGFTALLFFMFYLFYSFTVLLLYCFICFLCFTCFTVLLYLDLSGRIRLFVLGRVEIN